MRIQRDPCLAFPKALDLEKYFPHRWAGDFDSLASRRVSNILGVEKLIVLSHDRRRILHTAVTSELSREWTTQQFREAFPYATLPKYLVHDRDRNFSGLHKLDIRELITRGGCPWQNGRAERIIGSIRRECLDHQIILGEAHLRRVLQKYLDYYNRYRTHLSLEKDSPDGRDPQSLGKVCGRPILGGLHHVYERQVA